MLIFKALEKLNLIIEKRTNQTGIPYLAFGIFGLLNYPLSFVYWSYVNSYDYKDLILRIIATLLCLGLVVKKFWPKPFLHYFPLYWYFSILFSLPFFGTFNVLNNHLSSEWITNMLLGIFLFVLLVDWASFVVMLIIGTVFGTIFFMICGGQISEISSSAWVSTGYMYLFSLIIGGVFSRNNFLIKRLLIQEETLKKELAEKRAQYNKQAAGTIAHDLRTPLASINAFQSFLKRELPELIEGYKKARDANLLEGRGISNHDFISYLEAVDSMKHVVDYSNHYINMILGNLKHDTIKTDEYKVFSLLDTIKKALSDYPYNRNEKQLVHLDETTNFEAWGDPYYVTNIINNLLKNSFYFIKAANKGEIYIWLEIKNDKNILHVKDTAKGASAEICEQMFEPYFSARQGGTGLGLAFCKTIMHSFKGSVHAISIAGEYMHIIFTFPKSILE